VCVCVCVCVLHRDNVFNVSDGKIEIEREKAITGNLRFSTTSIHIIIVFFFYTDKHSSRMIQ